MFSAFRDPPRFPRALSSPVLTPHSARSPRSALLISPFSPLFTHHSTFPRSPRSSLSALTRSPRSAFPRFPNSPLRTFSAITVPRDPRSPHSAPFPVLRVPRAPHIPLSQRSPRSLSRYPRFLTFPMIPRVPPIPAPPSHAHPPLVPLPTFPRSPFSAVPRSSSSHHSSFSRFSFPTIRDPAFHVFFSLLDLPALSSRSSFPSFQVLPRSPLSTVLIPPAFRFPAVPRSSLTAPHSAFSSFTTHSPRALSSLLTPRSPLSTFTRSSFPTIHPPAFHVFFSLLDLSHQLFSFFSFSAVPRVLRFPSASHIPISHRSPRSPHAPLSSFRSPRSSFPRFPSSPRSFPPSTPALLFPLSPHSPRSPHSAPFLALLVHSLRALTLPAHRSPLVPHSHNFARHPLLIPCTPRAPLSPHSSLFFSAIPHSSFPALLNSLILVPRSQLFSLLTPLSRDPRSPRFPAHHSLLITQRSHPLSSFQAFSRSPHSAFRALPILRYARSSLHVHTPRPPHILCRFVYSIMLTPTMCAHLFNKAALTLPEKFSRTPPSPVFSRSCLSNTQPTNAHSTPQLDNARTTPDKGCSNLHAPTNENAPPIT